MLMLRRAGGSASGDGLSDAAGAAMLPHAPSYAPSKSQRWLCCAVGGLVALSLAARAAAGGLRRRARNVVPCAVSTAADYGRAPPGAVLSDSGGCAKASSLDSGVCVEGADGRRPSVRCVPTVAVIGAMKSGTTNIMLYLQQHPRLRTSENRWGWPVESRFFASAPSAVDAVGTWRDYLAIYPAVDASSAPGDRVRTFDKSPNYLPNAIVPSILAAIAPSLRIVVTLRNPTARAYSHFQHICRRGDVAAAAPLPRGAHAEDAALWARRNISAGANRRGGGGSEARARLGAPCPPAAFDAWARAELAAARRTYGADGDPRWWAAWALAPTNAGPLTRGLYAPQLRRWLEHFPADHLTILLYEEWLDRDRPEATWEALAALQAKIGVRSFDYRSSVKRAVAQAAYAWFPSRSGYAPPLRETVDLLEAFYCDANTELAALLGRAPEEMPRQYACPGRE